jgi:5-methylcytosine-specific restriction protein A
MQKLRHKWHDNKPEEKEREHSDPRYHTSRWTKLSRKIRERDPFCVECLAKGIYKPSEVCDHIIPAQLVEDFYDESNLRGVCKECNMKKGNREDKKYFRERVKGSVDRFKI